MSLKRGVGMNSQCLLSAMIEAALSNPSGASEPTFPRSLPALKLRAVLPDRVAKFLPVFLYRVHQTIHSYDHAQKEE